MKGSDPPRNQCLYSPLLSRSVCNLALPADGGSMSIFSKIKDAIFGSKAEARPNPPSAAPPAGRAPSASAGTAAPQPKPAPSAPEPVDVEAVLQKLAADNKQ